MIRFWALVYRLTGWYSPWAELYEYRYLKTQWDKLDKSMNHKYNDMNLDNHVGLTIGLWQANNGFYRKFKRK